MVPTDPPHLPSSSSTPATSSLDTLSSPRSSPSRVETAALHRDRVFSDGDFTVVTSDGVEFRVMSWVMFWASPLIADCPTTSRDKHLVLTDPKIETAAIFRLFLHVANTLNATGPGLTTKNADHIIAKTHLLFFLKKWKATHLFNVVLKSVTPSFATLPLQCFDLASRLDLPDLCLRIIHMASKDPSRYPCDADLWVRKADGIHSPFDSNVWSVNFWREHEIPANYLYALQQTYRNWEALDTSIVGEFEKAYTEAKASPDRRLVENDGRSGGDK